MPAARVVFVTSGALFAAIVLFSLFHGAGSLMIHLALTAGAGANFNNARHIKHLSATLKHFWSG